MKVCNNNDINIRVRKTLPHPMLSNIHQTCFKAHLVALHLIDFFSGDYHTYHYLNMSAEISEEFSKWYLVKSEFYDKICQQRVFWGLLALQWKSLVGKYKCAISSDSFVHTGLIKSLALGVDGHRQVLLGLVLQPGVAPEEPALKIFLLLIFFLQGFL